MKKMLLERFVKNSKIIADSYFQGIVIKKTGSKKLLKVIVDVKVNLAELIKTICQTAGKKPNNLTK